MKLTVTKSEGAIIQKLIADRKSDIHNIGGDSKQAERLSKLNKKIARQIKKQYKDMSPYVITSAVLITYDGKKIPLENIESEIMTRPIQLTKERILDAFSMMKDKPVDVELKIKHI